MPTLRLKKLALPCLAVLMMAVRLFGAEDKAAGLNLESAQAEAAAHSPALQKLDADLAAQSWMRLEALAPHLPQLDVKAQHVVDGTYPILNVLFNNTAIAFPGAFPQDTVDISARWVFFDGFRGWNTVTAANHGYRAARLEREHAGHQLEKEVAVRFYKALAALQLKAVTEQDVSTLKDHLDLAQASEASGSSTHVDVLRIQAQIEEAQANALQAADQADLARLDLSQAMGLSADARSLDGSLPAPDASLSVDTWTPDWEARGDIQAQDQRRQALDSMVLAAYSDWLPKLYVFGLKEFYHYGDFNSLILPSDGYPDMYMVGVGADWNLFAGGGDLAKQGEASAKAKSAASALEASRLEASQAFETWKRRYHYSVRLYQARLKSVEEYQESVRLAQLGFKAGTQTSPEVLDAETDLFRARAGLVQSQADAAEALLKLELLRGDPPNP